MEGGREGSIELASAERESDGHDRECTASSVEEKTLDMMLVTVKQCQRGLSISPTSRPQTCIKFNSFPSFLPLELLHIHATASTYITHSPLPPSFTPSSSFSSFSRLAFSSSSSLLRSSSSSSFCALSNHACPFSIPKVHLS